MLFAHFQKRPCAELRGGIEKFVLKNPSPFIIQVNHGGENFRGQDIEEPLDTITAKHGTGVVMPMMIQYHDEQGSEVRGQTVDKPIMTVDASNRYGMVSAFISKFYGTSSPASAADNPLPTVTAIDHNALCAAYVTQFNNNCDGQCADEPLNTITAGAGHFGDVRAFLVKYYGNGDNAASCEKPAPTITSKDRLGLVTVCGEKYQIVDIGLRMLTPRELLMRRDSPKTTSLMWMRTERLIRRRSRSPDAAMLFVRQFRQRWSERICRSFAARKKRRQRNEHRNH